MKSLKLDELVDREKLDPKKIIREAISRIPEGEIAYYDDLRRTTEVPADRFKDAQEAEEFSKNKAKLPGSGTTSRIVFGSEATIAEALKMDGVSRLD